MRTRPIRRRRDVAPDGACRGERAPRGRDRGVTFIEIVVSVTLIGIVVVPMLTAVISLTRASTVSREAANVETVLLNVADRVNRSDSTLCDYTAYAEAAVMTHGWSPSNVLVSHTYYDATNDIWTTGPAGASACPVAGDRPQLVKLVRVTVTSPDADISRTIEVVKSDI